MRYLLEASIVLSIVAIGGCADSPLPAARVSTNDRPARDSSRPVAQETRDTQDPPDASPQQHSGAAEKSQADEPARTLVECLTTPHGVKIKALIVRDQVQPLDQPGGTPRGQPLPLFASPFVFAALPSLDEPQYLELGTTPCRDSRIGFVAVPADAVLWSTRLAVEVVAEADVYRDLEPLREIIERGSTSIRPMARARPAQGPSSPWPIEQAVRIKTGSGEVFEAVRVHFLGMSERPRTAPPALAALHEKEPTPPPLSAQEVEELRRGVDRNQIVLAFDNTKSTRACLVGFRRAIRELIEAIDQKLPNVEVALLRYTDHAPGVTFTSESGEEVVYKLDLGTGFTHDLDAVLETVISIEPQKQLSKDRPEAGFEALVRGLREIQFAPYSRRAVVCVSDNSWHDKSSPRNPSGLGEEELLLTARGLGVSIHRICVCRSEEKDPDQPRHREQARRVAEQTGGSFAVLESGASQRVADRIVALFAEERQTALERVQLVDRLAAGEDRTAVVESLDAPARQEARRFFEFLEGAGVDLNGLQPGEPRYATGWALVRRGVQPLLRKRVLVGKNELERLILELHTVANYLDIRTTDELARRAFLSRVSPGVFVSEANDVEYGMDIHLAKQDIPTVTGILSRSRRELDSLPEAARQELREEIFSRVLPRLLLTRNSQDATYTYAHRRYFWVPEEDLP